MISSIPAVKFSVLITPNLSTDNKSFLVKVRIIYVCIVIIISNFSFLIIKYRGAVVYTIFCESVYEVRQEMFLPLSSCVYSPQERRAEGHQNRHLPLREK